MTSNVVQTITDRYLSRTKLSKEKDARAKKYLPGGDSRTTTYFFPYPSYMEKGKGCYLYDCDGNRYIDFINNFTSLIHGHAHPAVVEVATAQLKKGTAYASATALQSELASIICDRLPSVDLVRFCNSGTEATMMSMRAARAFTGKDVILKMDGGYHGSHDFAEVNIVPDFEAQDLPSAHVEGAGVPACILDGMMVTPFNDLDATERILEEHQDKIAAIIMEPVLGAGGAVAPKPGYLKGMRKLTDKYGVLLIFDEIITFRLSLGGLQRIEGIKPDLTALGKIIGGGFAVGAFGGKREIMEHFDPAHPQRIVHSGTFNGHNITMAAGIVTLQHYGQAEVDRIHKLGERLMAGFNQAFKAAGIKGRAAGHGSLLQVHWTDKEIVSPKESLMAMASAAELPRLLHLEMMNRGVFSATRGLYCVSTPMTDQEINQAIEAFEATLYILKPYVAETTPHLMAS